MIDRRKDDDMKEVIKEAFKEASQEWLDDKFRQFGKWTATGLLAMLFIWIVSLWVSTHTQDIKLLAGQHVSP